MLEKLRSVHAIVFIAIIILASFLRLYHLSTLPISLNIDETAIGYTAFSYLHQGIDEYGKFLPITYQSFGDWKLSGYPLIAVPFVALFGLNEFSTRVPSALAGIAQVILIYFLSFRLFRKKETAVVTSFFYALNPWSIYFSRIAFEVNVATTFFIAALLSFIVAADEKKSKLYLLSGILFGLTLYTYHSFIIATPLFLGGLGIIYFKKIPLNKYLLVSVILISVLSVISFFSLTHSISKFSHMSIIQNENTIYHRSDIFRTDGSQELPVISKILYNKWTAGLYQVSQNYLLSFSPTFLFDKGGTSLMTNLGYFGLFYILDAFLLIIGIVMLFLRKTKYSPLLVLWLIIAPIPSSITVDAPTSTRLFMMVPVLIILIGLGAVEGVKVLQKIRFYKVIMLGLTGVMLWNVLLFMDGYFVHMNYQRAVFQHYGYKQMVAIAKRYPTKKVIVQGPDNFPYISFLFYHQIEPSQFQKSVQYYPPTTQFVLVKSFDRYSFPTAIDFQHVSKNSLYFTTSQPNISELPEGTDVQTIQSPNGQVIFWYFTT